MPANPAWSAASAALELGLSAWQHPFGSLTLSPTPFAGIGAAALSDVEPGKSINDYITFQAVAGDIYAFVVSSPRNAGVQAFDERGFQQIATSISLPGFNAIGIVADHSGTFRVNIAGTGVTEVVALQIASFVTTSDLSNASAAISGGFTTNVSDAEKALIDPEYYFATNRDVLATMSQADSHFVQYGWHENRKPDPYFDPAYYLAHNPDVAALGIDPLAHYAQFGWKEGRDPSASFSTNAYLAHNADVRLTGMNPLQHYLGFGIAEGRSPT